ncbi:MAG: thiamine ABC transporter substrate-binding protein [Anaerolineaceae bacterium]|nr:thiamine ABC transporter substrate-binding protein [Anaerolineaceae bacterium]
MKSTIKAILVIAALVLMMSACGTPEGGESAVGAEPTVLTVMTHDSFAASEDVIAGFEAEHAVELRFVKAGDTGAALNKAILSKSAPLADVFFGVDNTFLSRALQEDIFIAYSSPLLDEIPDAFELDGEHRVLPVDYGDVCINYDRVYFDEQGLELPSSLDDLTRPEYAELLAVENPATSSPGLAFLLATIAEYGDPGYLDYWAALRQNGVVVVNDWETAYYSSFSASSGQGPQPMVVSYGSSPAAEVIFAETELTEAPTASLTGTNMCFRQVEFVGILKGTEQKALAEQFVDFMLGQVFQEDVPMQMFVFPVNENAALPAEFVDYAQIPAQPAQLDPEMITANREKWIAAWDEIVLR